jgi:hypothetical protein
MNHASWTSTDTLGMVTPRPAGQRMMVHVPASPVAAALPVIARVEDFRPASTLTHVATTEQAIGNAPNWVATLKSKTAQWRAPSMAQLNSQLAVSWAWAAGLPPIAKLGAMMVTVVVSLWMFGDKKKASEEVAADAWQRDSHVSTASNSSAPSGRVASKPEKVWRWDNVPAATQTPPAPQLKPLEFSKDAGSAAPLLTREASSTADRNRSRDEQEVGLVVPANVQPVEPYREARRPTNRDTWRDDTNRRDNERDGYNRDDMNRGDARGERREEAVNPPELPRRFSERPRATETSEYPAMQYNQYVNDPGHGSNGVPSGGPNRGSARSLQADSAVRQVELVDDPDIEAARRRAYRVSERRDADRDNGPRDGGYRDDRNREETVRR